METMTDAMMDAAKTAGISKDRAEIIYSMEVLGRKYYRSEDAKSALTSYESSWIVDVIDILSKDHTPWDPKAYHRYEKRQTEKKRIFNAVLTLLGEDAIDVPVNELDALATGLNGLMVELFDTIKLSSDDFAEIAGLFVNRGKMQSHEAKTGLEPPD